MGSVLANWRDIRFEPGARYRQRPGSTGIDPQYTTPLLAQPAVISGIRSRPSCISRDAIFGHVVGRSHGYRPDGGRYLLQ